MSAEEYHHSRGKHIACSAESNKMDMHHMQVMEGSSNLLSLAQKRYVAEIVPSTMLRMWGFHEMADDYDEAIKGRWLTRSEEWFKRFPQRDALLAVGKSSTGWYGDIMRLGAEGKWKAAVESMSVWKLNGTVFAEPHPGVLVLNNAFFNGGSLLMHDCQVRACMFN